ncbi:uncharacterized protein [Mobula birostris]|uniref:uncharacterized protein n=1 Tax=Mobula birostris TaxID=1983395 RepID=UPI003B282379
MIFDKKLLQSEERTKNERFSCSESLNRKWSCVYSNKYELFFDDGSGCLESRENLRDAFSDAEDYLDQGLISARRCASRTSSVGSWSENFRPSFTEKLKFKSVMEGEQTTFKCKMVASPVPKVAWFHNNRPIRKDSRKIIKTESTMHIHSSSLEINNVEEKDSGSYKIFAINSEGSAESTASLLVALKEEQNENYLSFVKRSVLAHKSVDSLVKNRNARLKVDLRHVGSPFDKKHEIYGALQKKPSIRSRLVRTMYFESPFTATKHKDLAVSKSAKGYSPRLCGMIVDEESLIDEDIRIKLHLLREAKRKKRFSLALSEASFDLGTTTEDYSHGYLDRERSRSVGDLDCMNCEHGKSYLVQEQIQSSGEYVQKQPLEFQQKMEQIIGLPAGKRELKSTTGEYIIEESSGTIGTNSLREQFLKGGPSQETEELHENQYWLEAEESGECYLQKEYVTRKEAKSQLCEKPHVPTDQLFGEYISVQKDLQSKHLRETFDVFTSGINKTQAFRETEVMKQAAQFADSECAEILLKEKEISTPVKQTQLEIKESENKYKLKKNIGVISNKRTESLQDSLARKTEYFHSLFDHSKATEKYESSFTEKEDITREYTQNLIPSSFPDKNISVLVSTPLDANAVEINKTSGKCETKENPAITYDKLTGSIFLKQMSGFDCRTVDQTKSASKENEAIRIIDINENVLQNEGKINNDPQTLVPSTLSGKKEISSFISSLIKDAPEDVKHIPYKSQEINYEITVEAWPERCLRNQNDLLVQKPGVGHEISDHTPSEMIDFDDINQKETQYEEEITDSTQLMRHSPLTAKTREAPAIFRPVIKQFPGEIKHPPKESEVHEEDEPTSEQSCRNFIHVEKCRPEARSEDGHEIQVADQSKLAVKQVDVIDVPEISPNEQYEGKVKDFTLILEPSDSQNKHTFLKETAAEMREPPYKSEVNEGDTKHPDHFADSFVSAMRELVTEKSEEDIETFSICTPVVKSAFQIIKPSLPAQKDVSTPLDTREPTEDYNSANMQQCGNLFQAQSGFLPGKLDENHQVYFQSLKTGKEAEVIYEDKIRQKESQSEAAVLNSTWMVKTSSLSEDKETSVYTSSLKKQSPVDTRDSPCNFEFEEDHVKALKNFTSIDKEVPAEKLEDVKIIPHKSALTETAMINRSEIGQKHQWEIEGPSYTVNLNQTVETPNLKDQKQALESFSSLMKEAPADEQHNKFIDLKESPEAETHSNQLDNHCPPVIVHYITSPKIKQGAPCVLECQFHGNPQPTVIWYKDERPIPQNRDYDIYFTENKSLLTISCTHKEHEGIYSCVIFNQYGTATTTCVLTLQDTGPFEEPLKTFNMHVIETPEDYAEKEYPDHQVEKEVESYFPPAPLIKSTLQIPNVSVPPPRPVNLSTLSSVVEIKITAPTPTPERDEKKRELFQLDEVEWTGSPQEPSSQSTKHKFKFSFDVICEPPEVVKELDKICCTEGETVMFECVISGEPAPVVTWIQNDRVLTCDTSKHQFEESGGTYRLYINDVSESDVGNYTCIAKNKDGEAQSTSSLTLEPVMHSFIYHLKDIELSEDETESPVSKMDQGEDVEQQCQKENSNNSLPLNSEKRTIHVDSEVGDFSPTTADGFSSIVSSLKEDSGEVVLDSLSSFDNELLSKSLPLREESNEIVAESVTNFVDDISNKCPSLEVINTTIIRNSDVTGSKAEKITEETCSVSQYLRDLDKSRKLSEDQEMNKEIEVKDIKCAFLEEIHEDSLLSEGGIKQVVESNKGEVEKITSEMELSHSVFQKNICDIGEDSVETFSKKDEPSENISIAQYLLTAREEEAPIHDWENNEAFQHDESGITSMEVEEVTFSAVYDYYNQNEEWTRSLSPESEMSIEISSTISDEIAENERFYTPPLASENFRSVVSAESFHTPLQSPGFVTPEERLPLLNAVGRSPNYELERFYTPSDHFRSPIDEGIETTPIECSRLSTEEQRLEAFSTPPQEAEAKGNEMPPAFIKPLTRKRIHEGGSLTFITEVIGCPIPDVKWYRRKLLLERNHKIRVEREGNLCILVIHNMQREDEGEYICNAVNVVGDAKSIAQVDVLAQDAKLVALPPPVTHQHVIEFDVQQEQTSRSPSPQEILLEVELDEHEVKEFEKQIKIITIPEFTPDNKNMIISLDVLPVMIADEYNVGLTAKENGDVKIDLEVTEMPPRFTSYIFDLDIPENTDAVFECSVTGIPPPEITWFKDDLHITVDGTKYIRKDNSNHSLKITNVCPSDNGIYSCKLVNSVGEATCRGYLAVTNSNMALTKASGRAVAALSLAGAHERSQELDVVVGDSSPDVNHSSEFEVEFEFEQGRDESQKSVKLVAVTEKGNKEKGEKCVNINFDVFAEPAKDETIQFKAEASETCSFEFQVTEIPPKFVISLLDCNTAIGNTASFQCYVTGTPKPSINWYFNDRLLEGTNYLIGEKDSGQHYLNIVGVTESDAGVYKCKAVNKAGNAVTCAVLKVFYA